MTQPDNNPTLPDVEADAEETERDPNAPYFTKPTSQLDLEARVEKDYAVNEKVDVDPNVVNDPYKVEGNDTSEYVGVDADRMTYANDTEKPLKGDGVEDKVAKELLKGNFAFGTDPEEPRKQTLGSGSSEPVVYPVTSGESVKTEIVDREAQAKANAKKATSSKS